ncbi:MAG: hypothetical protein ACI8ZM_004970 [Crocinitomix sp.]|jgi:membrane protein implicated in regulation of membrane protease activity
MKNWFKDNKLLAYGIIALVAIVVVLIILAKFWSHAIVAAVCLGIGYYFGRRHKKANEKKTQGKERTGFL